MSKGESGAHGPTAGNGPVLRPKSSLIVIGAVTRWTV